MNLKDIVPAFMDRDHWGPYVAEPAHGRCECGAIVALETKRNECGQCERAYDKEANEIDW
jgi:hypothetical protein